MDNYDNPDFLFTFEQPAVPTLPPALGSAKLWEMEADNSYLKYLYPKIPQQISEFVEEQCDQMEYEGSMMFDVYPDKAYLQIMAAGILSDFRKKYPDTYPEEDNLLRDIIEVILFHEIMYRRNRYRNHKRLYL
ncbi:MAG: hypothetical protein J1F02_00275 [Lachnospiraceae bacterium]|nr:hypothetical protein [Lachnospiraceae bacterium]